MIFISHENDHRDYNFVYDDASNDHDAFFNVVTYSVLAAWLHCLITGHSLILRTAFLFTEQWY